MVPPLARLTLAFILTTATFPGRADTLLLQQAIQETPKNNASGLERPATGMPMSQVARRFGEPLQQRESVGDPPITRWLYDRYTVYFEHDRVINTVVRRPAQAAGGKLETQEKGANGSNAVSGCCG